MLEGEPGGVQERGDGPLLVEAMLAGESEDVDTAEVAIAPFTNQSLDSGDAIGLGRLPQHIEESFGFAHRRSRLTSKARRK